MRGTPLKARDRTATTRVAVYTRKSTDENLDLEFNSLDAQRQAIEAYVTSQRGKGWTTLPQPYDDGGFSGGTTDRPAFQRLLADVDARRVDVVAVYKLDRLSRSQLDLLRTLEFFQEHDVRFVSITEDFNTATPMGRFALSMMGAIAQLEREQIAERTRDKMAATRRRGQFTGGRPILGYDLRDKRLVVNETEAAQVREIFKLYRDRASLLTVAEELNDRGWKTKTHTAKNGQVMHGRAFDKHRVRLILANVTYLGKVTYKGEIYEGEHEAIVDQATWDAAQELLKSRGNGRGSYVRWDSLLGGLVRCGVCGAAMGHHVAAKKDRRYRYYVCQSVQKNGAAACPGSRVTARDLETFVVDRIRGLGRDPKLIAETIAAARQAQGDALPELEAQLKKLEQRGRRLAGERDNIINAIAQGGGTESLVRKLGEIDQEILDSTREAEELRSQLAELDNQTINEADLRAALESFDPIWDALFPPERARIMHLLIETVVYDARDAEVEITFRAAGVRALTEETA